MSALAVYGRVKAVVNVALTVFENKVFALLFGANSAKYWDARFHSNWDAAGGRLQTTLFAAGFASQRFQAAPSEIIDYGCGGGDSLPVLRMRFPSAKLHYWDVSEAAMRQVSDRFGDLACRHVDGSTYDLVYCSNVIEHVADLDELLNRLAKMARSTLVIQAPLDETHEDGSDLSHERPREEHVRTIRKVTIPNLLHEFHWEVIEFTVPTAWDGKQVLFIGERRA